MLNEDIQHHGETEINDDGEVDEMQEPLIINQS